jgi:zinc finger HIT domain-containing protein 1
MLPPKQTAKGTPSRQPSTATPTIKPDPSTQSHSPYAHPHSHPHLPPTPTPYAAPSTLPVIPNPNDPLLVTPVPPLPSHALMNTLLSQPALSYHEARAAPSGLGTAGLGKGGRKFCEICGYWGRVKCLKCGARVCGLECLGSHEESRCLRFYG